MKTMPLIQRFFQITLLRDEYRGLKLDSSLTMCRVVVKFPSSKSLFFLTVFSLVWFGLKWSRHFSRTEAFLEKTLNKVAVVILELE